MTRLQKLLAIGLLAYHVLAWPAMTRADGGRLCASGPCGPWQVFIFGSRPLLGTGPSEFSVYVQDAGSGSPLAEVEVMIEATHRDTGEIVMATATTDGTADKTFRTASCDLSANGTWHVTATLNGRQQERYEIDFDFQVRQLVPPWFDMACWIGWPIVPIALFGIHRRLLRKEGTRPEWPPPHFGRITAATTRSRS